MSTSNNDEIQNENLNTDENRKKGGSQKKSWVWEWFESDNLGSTCKVEIGEGQLCEKYYKNGSSTGNLINHLVNKHQIPNGMRKQDFVVRKKEFLIIFISLYC